ncbi:MAG: hypothetical protein RLZZ175_3373 [Bacteroidota bacterium]
MKNRKIVNLLCYSDEAEKGFLLLDNGYIFTETIVAPHGTGKAGINIFESINELTSLKGNDFTKLTEQITNL